MHASSASKVLRIAWWITGLVALVLASATVFLAVHAMDAGQTGTAAYVVADNPSVTLRGEPSGSGPALGMLDRGQEVLLISTAERGGILWAQVYVDGEYGWLAASNLSSRPPEGER